MDIIASLQKILSIQKSVEIPGLGMLYKKKTPGRYDQEQHIFLPPKSEITLTASATEDDSDETFAAFLSSEYDIPLESAQEQLKIFVQQLQQQLQDQQMADFSPIGRLVWKNNEVVLTAPDAQESTDHTYFGLPPVPEVLSPAEAEDTPIEEPEPKAPDAEEPKPEEPEMERPEPVWRPTVNQRYEYEGNNDDDDENDKPGVGKRILRILLYILIAIILTAGMTYLFFPSYIERFLNIPFQNESDTSPVSQDQGTGPSIKAGTNGQRHTPDSIMTDSLPKTTATVKTVKTTPPPAIVNPATVKHPEPENYKIISYEVIGGAMKTHKKADEIVAQLEKKKIIGRKLESLPGKLIKISLGSFTNYNEAKRYQDSLKIVLKNPEIYIQPIKSHN